MNLFRCFAISFALSFAAACSSGPGLISKSPRPTDALRRDPCGRLADLYRDPPRYARAAAFGHRAALRRRYGAGTRCEGDRCAARNGGTGRRGLFYRQARFTEHYNQLRLTFEGGYAVTFRVFDQGCAYRIETHLPGERTVAGEVAEFNFAGDPGCSPPIPTACATPTRASMRSAA